MEGTRKGERVDRKTLERITAFLVHEEKVRSVEIEYPARQRAGCRTQGSSTVIMLDDSSMGKPKV